MKLIAKPHLMHGVDGNHDEYVHDVVGVQIVV